MTDGFLSQEEIDSLLNANQEVDNEEPLTEEEKDLLGEIGNISMATSATALSTILGKKVSITTPRVETTSLVKLQENLTIPNVVLQVEFEEGLRGTNILLINVEDASIIANLMMGGDGTNPNQELTDIEISAVSEAMNQMIGSASTSMATMLKKDINIYPPTTKIWDSEVDPPMEIDNIGLEESIVKISFRMTVDNLIDSEIMQIFTMDTVEDITNNLMPKQEPVVEEPVMEEAIGFDNSFSEPEVYFEEKEPQNPVSIQKPHFGELEHNPSPKRNQNIDMIMDVPLEFSVVLGKTQKTIGEVLALTPGSVVELNKFAEEPLEVYANGKLIAQGEVVVVNENFGIRITNIISATDRVKNLK